MEILLYLYPVKSTACMGLNPVVSDALGCGVGGSMGEIVGDTIPGSLIVGGVGPGVGPGNGGNCRGPKGDGDNDDGDVALVIISSEGFVPESVGNARYWGEGPGNGPGPLGIRPVPVYGGKYCRLLVLVKITLGSNTLLGSGKYAIFGLGGDISEIL